VHPNPVIKILLALLMWNSPIATAAPGAGVKVTMPDGCADVIVIPEYVPAAKQSTVLELPPATAALTADPPLPTVDGVNVWVQGAVLPNAKWGVINTQLIRTTRTNVLCTGESLLIFMVSVLISDQRSPDLASPRSTCPIFEANTAQVTNLAVSTVYGKKSGRVFWPLHHRAYPLSVKHIYGHPDL
jgi:hypothetical protein